MGQIPRSTERIVRQVTFIINSLYYFFTAFSPYLLADVLKIFSHDAEVALAQWKSAMPIT